MTVDYRTRCDTTISEVDITAFFFGEFPALIADAAPHIQPWLALNNPADFSIECEGTLWHLAVNNGQIQIDQNAAEAGLLVKLTASEFSGLVNDLYTPMTFFVSGSLNILRGEMAEFLDWWLIIRAVVEL